ncbi:MAG: stage V sporulation protein D [Thermincolia bacterium]
MKRRLVKKINGGIILHTTNVIIRKRITLLFIFVSLLLSILILRLSWIQFIKGPELQKMATDNRTRDVPVPAKRGTIYDRNGKELAVSISADTVYAFPAQIKGLKPEKQQEIANKVAAVLGLKPDDVLKKITKKSSIETIKVKIDSDKAKKLKEQDLPGISIVEQSKRHYPNDILAAHVLGFTNIDNLGGNGIEINYEKDLKGIPGKIVIERDATGRDIPQAMHKYIPPQEGSSLFLTIDETIQHFVERELDKIVEKYQPEKAAIIVMDTKTGGILAMGNRPTYNPNEYNKFDSKTWRNFAISDAFEPGSTFKVVSAAAGLEEGLVKHQDRFYDPGYYEVLGKKIKCAKRTGHGSQSFVEVMQNSCNTGIIAVGQKIGVEKYLGYVQAFGFGKKTGIPLPGEATGILVPAKRATILDLATMSIGQTNAVTPIQLITAMSSIANDGMLMKPQLVKEVRNINGEIIRTIQSEEIRQVVSKETARELSGILESIVAAGGGSKAYLEGYRAAGKTGTAQKIAPGGGYVSGKYVSSFMGFAPVNEPKLAVLVVIDDPKGGVYYGGQIAAPVFGAVMGDALKYLGVPPQISGLKKKDPLKQEVKIKETKVPDVINLPPEEARKALVSQGLKPLFDGKGKVILGQFPLAGATVPMGTEVTLYLVKSRDGENGGMVTVPDLKGKSMREVAAILGLMGLRLEPEGSGAATNQTPAAGILVKVDSVVKVKFEGVVKEPLPSVKPSQVELQ